MTKKIRAMVLFSGGLDSMLAAKLLLDQGIEVTGIYFTSNFFSSAKAEIAAHEIGIKLKIVDIKKELIKLVKNPVSGYGKNLNPCIDCHALMLKRAGEIVKPKKINVIATGEVLGQRPFSQTRDSLARVEKAATIEILRPLSAKKLPETRYEKQGLVNRDKLESIIGRTRARQMELAKQFKIKEYATPAGGCLLTDSGFSKRLSKMLKYWPGCCSDDIELLKYGRIFWLKTGKNRYALIIVGRHKEDNEQLERLAKNGDNMLQLKEIEGPLTLVRIINNQETITKQIPNTKFQIPKKLEKSELRLSEEKNVEEILEIAGLLTGYYATKARGGVVELNIKQV